MFSSSLPSTYLFVYLFLFSWGRGLYFFKIPSLPVLFSFYQLPRLAFKSKIPKHQPGYNWISEEMKNTNTPALPFESPIYNLTFWKGPRFTVSWIRAELKDLWRVLLYKEGKKQTKTRIILFKKTSSPCHSPSHFLTCLTTAGPPGWLLVSSLYISDEYALLVTASIWDMPQVTFLLGKMRG